MHIERYRVKIECTYVVTGVFGAKVYVISFRGNFLI